MIATDSETVFSVDVSGLALEPDVLGRVPRSLALRHDILCLASDGNQITIAVPDVDDLEAIDRVRLATGMHVRAVSASREVIRARLSEAYSSQPAQANVSVRPLMAQGAPAVRLLDEIHESALAARASDIHIEPARSGGRVRVRVDGVLQESKVLAGDLHVQLVSRVKVLAGMDIADRRQPQDGRYGFEVFGHSVDARISSMPTMLGEKIVIRLLDHSVQLPSLESLGMPQRYLPRFRRAIRAPHGFVVVCGPTGSGKTTTLYAAMAERDVASENLCSVEDPVEVCIPGVAQVQVNPRAGVTFASALRGFLRQDPNAIMVGETRDPETAAVAACASLSGQLVLTTLHSNDAPTALDRLFELGSAPHTVASGLTAILAQRLVRRLCPDCRRPRAVAAEVARDFAVEAGGVAFDAPGCAGCRGSGYRGRTAIFECIFIDEAMRSKIARGESGVAIAELAGTRGYEPMIADGVRRALAGETTFDELRRVLAVGARR